MLKRLTLLFWMSLVLIQTTLSFGGDWPTYMYDNTRRGSITEELKMPLAPGWTIQAPSQPHLSWGGQKGRIHEGKVMGDRIRFDDAFHLTVKEGRGYYSSTVDHQVHCINSKTGEEIWSFFTGGPVRLAPTLYKELALFGSDDGHAYCLNAKTGELLWKIRPGSVDHWLLGRGEMVSRWPVRTSVTVDEEGIAYFGAGLFPYEDIFLYAVEAETGKVIWKRDNISQESAYRNDISPQGYLLIENDLLVLPSGRSLPATFDRKTGEFMHKSRPGWRGDAGGVVGGTRAFLADGQIYAAGPHHMLALDQKTGKPGFGYFQGKQVAVADDLVFTLHDKKLNCFNRQVYAEASKIRHELKQDINKTQRKVWSAKGDDKKALQKEIAEIQKNIDSSMTQGQKWSVDCPLESSLIVCGNAVVVGGEGGIHLFDRASGGSIADYPVAGEATGLAIADGALYVSSTNGDIYSFTAEPTNAPTPAEQLAAYPVEEPNADLCALAAEDILKQTGIDSGFCLVIGAEQGRLAYELAQRSKLKIYAVEADPAKVQEARERLLKAGLYGHRVVVHEANYGDIPYSNYFANLVVSETHLTTGKVPATPESIARFVKPIGGKICLGQLRTGNSEPEKSEEATDVHKWLTDTQLVDRDEIEQKQEWQILTRPALEGAADWSHQYGNAGNTASTEDRRVKGGLSVLWYGDPGAKEMVNRHEGAVGPLSVNGRLIVQGQETVMAYDAFNGQPLWERANPRSIRTGVFKNENPGNLVASDSSIFIMEREICWELDAATGEVIREHRVPEKLDRNKYEWGYVAYNDGILFGTATIREEIEKRQIRRGKATKDKTDTIFAIDVTNGKHLWSYSGDNISHHTVAHGPKHVFFIDSSLTAEQRKEFLKQDKSKFEGLEGEELKKAEAELKKIDARLATSLNARTGEIDWQVPVDVTDCSDIGTGGGKLTLMYQNDVLILCGANANGHYWKQFMSGEFSKRRLVALAAADGEKLWSKDANYRHRPIIIEDQIFAEPWAFDLYSGTQKMRENPITGEEVPWSIMRSGHHCGMMTGSPNMLMFRSGFTSFYDLEEDQGTKHFAGHRMGCWINAIPANGLVMVPESSAGCVCLFSLASTITLEPRADRSPWTIYSLVGQQTPVKHMALNIGAPGDRRDSNGTVWLGYPRPRPSRETSLDYKLNLEQKFAEGGDFEDFNDEFLEVESEAARWVYSSFGQGLKSLTLPLLSEGQEARKYNVTLHFTTPEVAQTADPILFDIKANGEVVQEGVKLEPKSESTKFVAQTIALSDIAVENNLSLEIIPQSENADKHVRLSGLEILAAE